MNAFIYCLIDTKNDVPFYVGSTLEIKRRSDAHKYLTPGSNQRLYKYIRLNKINYTVEEIDCLDIEIKTDKLYWEGYWICQLRAWGFEVINKILPTGHKINIGGLISSRCKNGNLIKDVEVNDNEKILITLIFQGKCSKEIANVFNVSVACINKTIREMMLKYDVNKQSKLVYLFLRNKLID